MLEEISIIWSNWNRVTNLKGVLTRIKLNCCTKVDRQAAVDWKWTITDEFSFFPDNNYWKVTNKGRSHMRRNSEAFDVFSLALSKSIMARETFLLIISCFCWRECSSGSLHAIDWRLGDDRSSNSSWDENNVLLPSQEMIVVFRRYGNKKLNQTNKRRGHTFYILKDGDGAWTGKLFTTMSQALNWPCK